MGIPLAAGAAPPMAFDFPAPAMALATQALGRTTYDLPIGPWRDGALPTRRFDGTVSRMSWRIDTQKLTTLDLLTPLRDQLLAQGYTVLLDCETEACGGFDFRYSTPVIAEPDMHVDLGDFRFLAAENGPGQAVGILVSRSTWFGYVQITTVGTELAAPTPGPTISTGGEPAEPPAPLSSATGFARTLETTGSVALDDLAFEPGSSRLGPGDFASLTELADFLKADPTRRVVLVGHTDALGGLAANTALSKARATAVRDRLIGGFAIPGDQVSAEGAGYLAPRDTNLTEEGRARNRRVEVILTSTQ